MELRQILNMLQGVSGPNASGEYTAKCPAHEDHTASLTVTEKESTKDGKRKIYLCCHAHCDNKRIMEVLRITPKDLIVNPDPDGRWKGNRSGRQGAAQGDSPAVRKDSHRGQSPGAAPSDRDAPPEVDPETGEIIRGVTVHTMKGEGGNGSQGGGSGKNGSGGNGSQGKGNESQGRTGGQGGSGSSAEKKEELKIDWAHPDKVYSYQGPDGAEVFQVVRYHYLNAEGKTFRQRRYLPGDEKANRDGYVNSVTDELRDTTIYKLPDVIRAIADGKPVYVVEGEKDVETLNRLGFCATCNAGGAGKWRDGHSRKLHGADVIILPDCDTAGNEYAGQNHAYDVAVKLKNEAQRVRLVDLKAACPEIPEKGDISDMVALMGDVKAMDALAKQVAMTPDFDPNDVPFWLTPAQQAERLYRAVPGYGVKDGCIVQVNGDTTKALTDFFVIPRQELIQDDGVGQSLSFVLDGWNSNQRKLGRVTIPAGSLDSMDWVTKSWGLRASLTPGSTVKGKVVWAIKKVGQVTARRVTEYTHSGWRRIGRDWCYLYNGGAIGKDGITVNMGDNLSAYRLDGSGAEGFDQIPYPEAAKVSLRIRDAMKEEIGTALLGTMYLSPLREWLSQSDITPAFVLFLYGPTGNHKTTAAALAMAHFGNFHAKNPPASFNDTSNMIREKAFLVKDMPLLVDDFHPVSTQQERRQRDGTAQTLSRSFGDGSDRGRLNADGSVRAKHPPRSVAVITGEDLPSIGASGLARYFILDIDKGDIPITEELTELQELARKGYLQRAMRGYIQWLMKQADSMPDWLRDLFYQFRTEVRAESEGQHDRAPETVACLLVGYFMMLNYFRDLGIITTEEAARMQARARRQLLGASRKQAATMDAEKPTRIFLDGLSELLNSRQASVVDLTADTVKEPYLSEQMVGYRDADYYYLLPNLAFRAVAKLCREEGTEFPVSLKALYKHLRTDGVIEVPEKGEDMTRLKRVTISGVSKAVRVFWIPAELISGPKAIQEQMKMTDVTGQVDHPF